MAASKVNAADAQEWLESLQQVGEGWYRQVALAVRAGAHKALSMERREFAQAIGQRMIDPREAIIELHREGHSQNAIADVLGVSTHRVGVVLAEEGLIVMTPHRQKQIDEGRIAGGGTSAQRMDSAEETSAQRMDGEDLDLHEEVEALRANLAGEKANRQKDAEKAKTRIANMAEKLRQAVLDAEAAANAATMSDRDRARVQKEAEAFAAEQGQKVLTALSSLLVSNIVSAIDEATETLRELIANDGVAPESMRLIESAAIGLTEELNRARMSVQS